jgi:hypothetical protein
VCGEADFQYVRPVENGPAICLEQAFSLKWWAVETIFQICAAGPGTCYRKARRAVPEYFAAPSRRLLLNRIDTTGRSAVKVWMAGAAGLNERGYYGPLDDRVDR